MNKLWFGKKIAVTDSKYSYQNMQNVYILAVLNIPVAVIFNKVL